MVGECGNCDQDKYGAANGVASFYEGTYATLLYQINSGGSVTFDTPQGTSIDESNPNLLWWDTISNSGRSNPIFSDTIIHGCSPLPSSGSWTVAYNCTLRNTFTAPNNVIVSGTASLTVLTIPQNVILYVHLKQYNIQIGPIVNGVFEPGGILIQPQGMINTN